MVSYNYSTEVKENMAKAVLRAAPVSHKHSLEISNMIRGRKVSVAKTMLEKVIKLEKAVPFKRFNGDVGHKPGIGPGRYPVKAAEHILGLLNTVEANAQFKGLSTEGLLLKHICSHRASRPIRFGRQRGRLGKRANIEVVVMESDVSNKEKSKSKQTSQKVNKSSKQDLSVNQENKKNISKVKITEKDNSKVNLKNKEGIIDKKDNLENTENKKTDLNADKKELKKDDDKNNKDQLDLDEKTKEPEKKTIKQESQEDKKWLKEK